MPKYTLFDFSDRTIFGIEHTEDEKMLLHLYGYGYYSGAEEEKNKPYRFVEYTWLFGTLEDLKNAGGFKNFELEQAEFCNQYIKDCSKTELEHIYRHYDNGKMPKFISEQEIETAKDGVYILGETL